MSLLATLLGSAGCIRVRKAWGVATDRIPAGGKGARVLAETFTSSATLQQEILGQILKQTKGITEVRHEPTPREILGSPDLPPAIGF